jgi:hypothetical protein
MRTRVDDFFSKIYMMKRHMVGILLDCGLEVVRAAGASLDPADVGVPLNSFDRSVLFSFWRGISLGFGAGAKAHSDAKSKICQLIAFVNQSEVSCDMLSSALCMIQLAEKQNLSRFNGQINKLKDLAVVSMLLGTCVSRPSSLDRP